jgi:hypothetical protein
MPQLQQILELIKHPDRTNELVPPLQLPVILDVLIEHLAESSEFQQKYILQNLSPFEQERERLSLCQRSRSP